MQVDVHLEKGAYKDEELKKKVQAGEMTINKAYNEAKEKEKTHKTTFNRVNENIEWAKWSWNPVTGCKHGCSYCYARDIANRFYPNGFEPTFYPERLAAADNTKVPETTENGERNVFVCSMADLFGAWVPQQWIDDVLDVTRKHPKWNFIFLTKNPQRLINIDFPKNAWVGTTVDIQARVEPAEKYMKQVNAKVKFISCEPFREELHFKHLDIFDWVIIGGQSESSKEPAFQPEWSWVESLMKQAREAKCKIYCKPNLSIKMKEYPKWEVEK